MDLRVKRTLGNIKEAYFSICKKKSVDKISVKELSEKAMINKATFYLHYKDIYDLNDKLKLELMRDIVEDIKEVDVADTPESHIRLAQAITGAVISRQCDIDVLFGDDKQSFIDYLEKIVIDYVCNEIPQYKIDNEKQLLLSYIIYGSYNIISKKEYSKEFLSQLCTKYSLRLLYNGMM